MVRVAFLSVANPYIGHRYEDTIEQGASRRRRTLLGGEEPEPKSFTKYYRSAPMFARSSLYAVCKKTYTATAQSVMTAESARRRLLGGGFGGGGGGGGGDIYHGRVDPGIAKVSDRSLSKEARQKLRWEGNQFQGEGCEVRFGGIGMMDDPDDASLKYMGGADGFAWDNRNLTFGESKIFNLQSLVSNMHDPGVTGVECRLMESDSQKGMNAEDYSLDEGDGVDDLNANGAKGVKYEGISANENEQLSVKQYSLEHLKKFCSDPALVASETPAECCQDQRHIRDVKYLSCDSTRGGGAAAAGAGAAAARRLLGGKDVSDCREVMQPDNVFDANLQYKIKAGGYQNRMKNGEGLYAGVLDSYNDVPVDLQTGKMCVFLQASKPAPNIGIHLAGIRAAGQESPFINCYSRKGAASYSYVDVNYAKADDLTGMTLTYDYFDYVGDNYVKDTAPLMDASPSFIGNAMTCELLKKDKRTVIVSQTFDFEHVMRHCHLHDDPGAAGTKSKIFEKSYARRRLQGGSSEAEDIITTKAEGYLRTGTRPSFVFRRTEPAPLYEHSPGR